MRKTARSARVSRLSVSYDYAQSKLIQITVPLKYITLLSLQQQCQDLSMLLLPTLGLPDFAELGFVDFV